MHLFIKRINMTAAYEKALAKHYNNLSIIPVPLISWDFFGSQNFEINKFNAIQKQWKSKVNFREINAQSKLEIIITNVNQEIVFASQGINAMNGYQPFEIIGKSPKIFQGKLTSDESKNNIRKAIQNELPFKEVVLNYRKDGTSYLCEIEAFPKFDVNGDFVNYIAFERLAS